MGAQLGHGAHGGGEVLLGDGGGGLFLGGVDGRGQRFFLRQFVALGVGRAGVFVFVLLLLDAQDVGGALDAGEQVLAVVGVEEFAERLDAADDHQQIVLATMQRKTASTRSWRAPCSRKLDTFIRSAKI